MQLESLIENYGLLAVLFGTAFEGETAAFLGGVAAHRHLLGYAAASITASVGSFSADQMFFYAGRYMRRVKIVQRIISKPAVSQVHALLERHPTGFVLAFRFLPGLRTISPVVIGTTTIPAARFLILNAVAATVWGQLFTGAGYLFGQAIESLLGRLSLHIHLLIALVAAIALLVTGFAIRRYRTTG